MEHLCVQRKNEPTLLKTNGCNLKITSLIPGKSSQSLRFQPLVFGGAHLLEWSHNLIRSWANQAGWLWQYQGIWTLAGLFYHIRYFQPPCQPTVVLCFYWGNPSRLCNINSQARLVEPDSTPCHHGTWTKLSDMYVTRCGGFHVIINPNCSHPHPKNMNLRRSCNHCSEPELLSPPFFVGSRPTQNQPSIASTKWSLSKTTFLWSWSSGPSP